MLFFLAALQIEVYIYKFYVSALMGEYLGNVMRILIVASWFGKKGSQGEGDEN